MVNSDMRRRLRHVGLLLLAWYVLVPGAGEPVLAGNTARAAAAAGTDTAGLAVLVNNVIIRADGSRRTLDLPAGMTAAAAAQVPAGWIVEGRTERQRALYLFGATGAGRRIGYLRGTWDITPSGRSLVASSVSATPSTTTNATVTAYSLPSLQQRTQRFAGGVGPLVIGATSEAVLVRQAQREPKAAIAAVWHLSSNTLRATTAPAWVWSIAGGATVLRRVDRLDAARKVIGACLDAVDASRAAISLGRTGVCSATAAKVIGGMLSPDARWAVLAVAGATTTASPTIQLARVSDLKAGRWQPVSMGAERLVQFWDSPTTMIVASMVDKKIIQQRCDTAARCTTLRLPTVGTGQFPLLVPRFGG